MGALKSPFRVSTSICLLIVAISVAFAAARVSIKNAEDIGFVYAKQQGFAEQQSLMVEAYNREQVFSFAVASRVGGVILQAIAQPESLLRKTRHFL